MAPAQSSPPATEIESEIRLLRPDDVPLLHLGRHRRANDAVVKRVLTEYPNRSVWSPETLEFALVAPWRHRRDVAVIDELSAVKQARPLLQAAVRNCRREGDAVALMMEMDERRQPSFYGRAGLRLIENVITYELPKVRPIADTGELRFGLANPARPEQLAALLQIDHAAFPWLWWNSEEEFRVYGESPGTELHLGTLDSRPVAYVGVSLFPGWGHLDRIAVDPAVQGGGLGRQTLIHAINVLHGAGARRIALSTQQENTRSQRLYEGFGFRRSPGYDYRLYGAALNIAAAELMRSNQAESGQVGDVPGLATEDDTNRWAAASANSSSSPPGANPTDQPSVS